jgi:hypothetical protein
VGIMCRKLQTLETGDEKNVFKQVERMCGKIGARLLAPSRCSDLGPKEEKVRCELSWQQMDQRIWIAGVAKQQELGNWVADPKRSDSALGENRYAQGPTRCIRDRRLEAVGR